MSDAEKSGAIHLVTTGEYSAYCIEAAFAREEDASRVAESIDGRVEEFDLISDAGEPTEVLQLSMRQGGWNGRIIDEQVSRHDQWPWFSTRIGELDIYRRPGQISDYYKPPRWVGWMYVQGTDHERVAKVYGEQKASVLAELDELGIEWEWPTPEPEWVKAQRVKQSLVTGDVSAMVRPFGGENDQ